MSEEAIEALIDDVAREGKPQFDPEQTRVFARGLRALNEAGVPYLIAGAMAKHAYTGIWRNTKDLDIFLKPADLEPALAALAGAGFDNAIEFRHWLAKARQEPYFIDVIFGTGHGQLQIDDSWFDNSRSIKIAGVQAQLIPPEELIVSKMYVAERYRFDGADVLHVIQGTRGKIDWQRILTLLDDNATCSCPTCSSLPLSTPAAPITCPSPSWSNFSKRRAGAGPIATAARTSAAPCSIPSLSLSISRTGITKTSATWSPWLARWET